MESPRPPLDRPDDKALTILELRSCGLLHPGRRISFGFNAGECATERGCLRLVRSARRKASGLLEQLGNGGWLVANEVIGSRVNVLRYNLARIGNPRYLVLSEDSQVLAQQLAGQFDVVLVDAPCSGQTLTIKDKRSENAFDKKQIEHSAARQRRILRDAIRLLKVGGRLIYSTCTFADEENEGQIAQLLQDYPDSFQPLSR